MAAAAADDAAAAGVLLARGAKVNRRTRPGRWTALHFAARANSVNVAKLLLNARADPNSSASDGTAMAQRNAF